MNVYTHHRHSHVTAAWKWSMKGLITSTAVINQKAAPIKDSSPGTLGTVSKKIL